MSRKMIPLSMCLCMNHSIFMIDLKGMLPQIATNFSKKDLKKNGWTVRKNSISGNLCMAWSLCTPLISSSRI